MSEDRDGTKKLLESYSGFDQLLGLELTSIAADEITAVMAIADHHKQPAGYVHGGVIASVGESLASIATWKAVADDGQIVFGQSNNTSFLRPLRDGNLRAHGRRVHRAKRTWIWDIEISNDDHELCALVRMTVAIREPRDPQPNERG